MRGSLFPHGSSALKVPLNRKYITPRITQIALLNYLHFSHTKQIFTHVKYV